MKVNYTDDFKDKPIEYIANPSRRDDSINGKAIVVYDSDSEVYTKEYLEDVDNYFKDCQMILESPSDSQDIFDNLQTSKYILSDHKEYIFKKSYSISEDEPADYDITAHIKNMGNRDLKITKLEIEKDVKFTLDGKERTERAILRFEDTDEKDMLYSAQYEFAGRKFAKNYVKQEYKTTEPRVVSVFKNSPFYKIVVEKKPVNDTLETIFEKLIRPQYEVNEDYNIGGPNKFHKDINCKVYRDFKDICHLFNEYINNKNFSELKKADLAKIFVESLKSDKEVTYELNEKLLNFLTSKTR